MNRTNQTLLKIAVIILLLVAVFTTQRYNYYVFLRWAVFLSSIYLAYNDRKSSVVFAGFFIVLAILFNPIYVFHLPKKTWRVIDSAVSAWYLFTIAYHVRFELPSNWMLILRLVKKCLIGIILLIGATYLYFVEFGNPYNEYRLITKASIANGFVTHSEEEEDTVEQGNSSAEVFDVYYEYFFVTETGQRINSQGKTTEPTSGLLSEASKSPIPIVVEYLRENPRVNRIQGLHTQCKTVIEFVWRRLGFGILLLICFCSFGFIQIRAAILAFKANRSIGSGTYH